jgi:ATP-dependent DNA helicase RecG
MVRELADGPLAGLRLALVHGRMKARRKDAVMRSFKAGEHDVLVSTTVIEVGIDVPNATVDRDRARRALRLAQLHQLRGPVGRGRAPGRCFLVVPDRRIRCGFFAGAFARHRKPARTTAC